MPRVQLIGRVNDSFFLGWMMYVTQISIEKSSPADSKKIFQRNTFTAYVGRWITQVINVVLIFFFSPLDYSPLLMSYKFT